MAQIRITHRSTGAMMLRDDDRGWSAAIRKDGGWWYVNVRDETGTLRHSAGCVHRTLKAAEADARSWLDPKPVVRSESWRDA